MPRKDFLAPATHSREQSHRRLILLGIGALVLLTLSPVLGHHVSARADAALLAQDHLWTICLVALHALLAPVHGVFHALLAVGVVYAIWDRAVAATRLHRVLAFVAPEPCQAGSVFATAASSAGVAVGAVWLVDGLPNPAFTAGWWRPRIYIARELGDVLTDAQIAATLAHEGEHVRRRDPLRLSLLRFLGCTLFWIPAFRRFAADMADEAEIAADDAAAGDRPLVLASAILALANWPLVDSRNRVPHHLSPGTAVGLVDQGPSARARFDALLDRRIRRLAGETVVVASHITRRSLASATAILALGWISGIAVAHPMPGTGMSRMSVHCEHGSESALSHLFCLRDLARTHSSGATSVECPHRLMAKA